MTEDADQMMIAAAAEAEGSSREKVMSRDRHYTTTRARAAAVWLIFKVRDASFREIGALFNIAHQSVQDAIEVHEKRMLVDEHIRDRSNALVVRFMNARAA